MNKDYSQILLKDTETKNLLKVMILEKADRYEQLITNGKVLTDQEIDNLLKDNITYRTIKNYVDHFETSEELKVLIRDLSSMCFSLNKSSNKIIKQTNWEKQYRNATQEVRIATIISHFLYIDGFKRNIKCPFHEDKNASLKVYTKDNRFICFGCGAKGSPIDFVMQFKNCSFKEAVNYLSNF